MRIFCSTQMDQEINEQQFVRYLIEKNHVLCDFLSARN